MLVADRRLADLVVPAQGSIYMGDDRIVVLENNPLGYGAVELPPVDFVEINLLVHG